MYCVKCGVRLADSEAACPLCKTRVFHPDLVREAGEDLYPRGKYPSVKGKSYWPLILLTVVFLLPIVTVLLCDLQFNRAITWAGFVIGALLCTYVLVVLPAWFKSVNPVIFAPCDFAALALYLLYIDLETGGGWFLSFALPVLGGVAIFVVATAALVRYLPRRARLFIFGGGFLAFGAFMPIVELLIDLTFAGISFIGWSLYPLAAFLLLGGTLLFLGSYRPARETMERIFFI